MKVGDLIEAHKGEIGIILGIELIYPGNRHSPPRGAMIHWLGKAPRWHRRDVYAHISGIKKVISESR